jgi:hypothetical protein
MLADVVLRLGDREVAPFAPSLVVDPADAAGLPGHLRVLGAEFLAVPFGSAPAPDHPVAGWEDWAGLEADEPGHGHAADLDWELAQPSPDRIDLTLEPPATSPIARIERTVAGIAARPRLEIITTLYARRGVRVPMGLHPILALPERPGALRIEASAAVVHGAPGPVSPTGRIASGARSIDLCAVPAAGGGVLDLTRLPWGGPVDDVALLTGVTGPIRVVDEDAGTAVIVDWDRDVLPSVMVWIHDRGLDGPPWRGRYRGLGVEPVAAAFDLPEAVSAGENPLALEGVRTTVALDPSAPVVIRSSFEAEEASRP